MPGQLWAFAIFPLEYKSTMQKTVCVCVHVRVDSTVSLRVCRHHVLSAADQPWPTVATGLVSGEVCFTFKVKTVCEGCSPRSEFLMCVPTQLSPCRVHGGEKGIGRGYSVL
jgi:hypothetical protein